MLALRAAHYTRMGAAIRHVGARLQQCAAAHRLLIVLTDGRPHDPTNGYVGRYALQDTRRALLELRARGVHCFGITIDQRGADYLPQLFGPGHYALLADPRALPRVLLSSAVIASRVQRLTQHAFIRAILASMPSSGPSYPAQSAPHGAPEWFGASCRKYARWKSLHMPAS